MEHYLTSFETFEQARASDPQLPLRKQAMARFAELGFPTPRLEDWRFTNVAPLAKSAFALGVPSTNGAAPADVARLGLAPGLVFVDGCFREDLSVLPEGVSVERPVQLPDEVPAGAFAALNTAFATDGFTIRVSAGATVADPVHVLFVGTDKACHPRNTIVVEKGAQARIVETYASLEGRAHWTNSVTRVDVAANATLEHTRLQLENDAAFHVAATHLRQERDSNYTSHAVTCGGRLVRNEIVASLDGENISCTLNGLYLTRGEQHVDNHTWIEHRKPHCESHELYKGILDGKSSAVFAGRIHVFEDAQKTDAFQASRSLLLSDTAVVDNLPQLEIYADDVKCSHGSTTGQLDKDALFYLRSRGLAPEQARRMLVRAFAGEVGERIGVDAARERVESLLAERLPGDAAGR